MIIDVIWARGHGNVRATHRNTIEVTKDNYITERGDCIIACCADKAASDLDNSFKKLVTSGYSLVLMIIVAGSSMDIVVGLGLSGLRLTDERRIIVRRSGHMDDATIMLLANKAAKDLDRDLINKARDSEPIEVILIGSELKQDE
ncbi:DUF371 domain-containing protein [Caldivirga sp. UBA161]|uniref:DUF371 domain-containing protein n=1 Tax=Caldivirga sp. UBA161 TaxID=1915569 RepID=UPI0025BEDDA1|nr:DUF371 domain-containing protein [Caldivirga sp. UBA161]